MDFWGQHFNIAEKLSIQWKKLVRQPQKQPQLQWKPWKRPIRPPEISKPKLIRYKLKQDEFKSSLSTFYVWRLECLAVTFYKKPRDCNTLPRAWPHKWRSWGSSGSRLLCPFKSGELNLRSWKEIWCGCHLFQGKFLLYINLFQPFSSLVNRVSQHVSNYSISENGSIEALQEADSVHRAVTELTSRISQELRMKIVELQSFSPDELGNIPRRSNQMLIISSCKTSS